MDSRLGALPDDIEALKAALVAARGDCVNEAARAAHAEAELAVARAKAADDLQAWLTLPSCLASSSSPTFARMIFCSVVMVSSNRRGGALRNSTSSAPRLGS